MGVCMKCGSNNTAALYTCVGCGEKLSEIIYPRLELHSSGAMKYCKTDLSKAKTDINIAITDISMARTKIEVMFAAYAIPEGFGRINNGSETVASGQALVGTPSQAILTPLDADRNYADISDMASPVYRQKPQGSDVQQNVQPPYLGQNPVQQNVQPPYFGQNPVQQNVQPPHFGQNPVRQNQQQPFIKQNYGAQNSPMPNYYNNNQAQRFPNINAPTGRQNTPYPANPNQQTADGSGILAIILCILAFFTLGTPLLSLFFSFFGMVMSLRKRNNASLKKPALIFSLITLGLAIMIFVIAGRF